MTDDKLIETTCDIADMILRLKFGQDYEKKCIVFKNDDYVKYRSNSQKLFNEIYDQVENLILEIVGEK
jgi:hypothetical protein|tara:strand:+ start:3085 stop:3288 length:204 start_codon:yes stop_codon:yes gene_type:complete